MAAQASHIAPLPIYSAAREGSEVAAAVTAIVVGNINVDHVVYLERLPSVDEGVGNGRLEIHFGGKGANQAVALARLGARVYIVGKVGLDSMGEAAIENLRRNGVAVDHVSRTADAHTGVCLVMVDRLGRHMMATAPGANALIRGEEILESARSIGRADVILTQLSLSDEALRAVARASEEVGARLILTPSPPRRIPREVLARTHTLIPNRVEILRLAGLDPGEASDEALSLAASALSGEGVENVVITMGEDGAAYYDRSLGRLRRLPGIRAERVEDTTGAGDAFAACYSYSTALGRSLEDSIIAGMACASIKISRRGAQQGLPRIAFNSIFNSTEDR